jgi:hypothetical protein
MKLIWVCSDGLYVFLKEQVDYRQLWVISMENSGSPAPLSDKTNTTDGGNQNRRAIIIFNSSYCLYYINDN